MLSTENSLFEDFRPTPSHTDYSSNPSASLLSPAAVQQQLLQNFALSIAPGDHALNPALRNHGRWLAHLPPRTGSYPLLDVSVRACTLAHLGLLHHSDALMLESRTHYGKALRLLNEDLGDPAKGAASETLSATILLSFYELFASSTDQSWIRHAGGVGTLMKIRGPSRHRTGFDRDMFLAYRHALIIQSFEADQACFLDEPEWRQLAGQVHEDIRNSGAVGEATEIFDISEDFYLEMAHLPALTADMRHTPRLIRAAGGNRQVVLDDLRSRAGIHRAKLRMIFVRLTAALKNIGQEPKSRLSGDPVMAIQYDYVNIFIASNHTGYWTVSMLVNIILCELEPSSDRNSLFMMENVEAARDCCRSVAYMAKSSFLGPFFIIFALRVSLIVLKDPDQRTWILDKLTELGHSRMAMAHHLPGGGNQTGMPRVHQGAQELPLDECTKKTWE